MRLSVVRFEPQGLAKMKLCLTLPVRLFGEQRREIEVRVVVIGLQAQRCQIVLIGLSRLVPLSRENLSQMVVGARVILGLGEGVGPEAEFGLEVEVAGEGGGSGGGRQSLTNR